MSTISTASTISTTLAGEATTGSSSFQLRLKQFIDREGLNAFMSCHNVLVARFGEKVVLREWCVRESLVAVYIYFLHEAKYKHVCSYTVLQFMWDTPCPTHQFEPRAQRKNVLQFSSLLRTAVSGKFKFSRSAVQHIIMLVPL